MLRQLSLAAAVALGVLGSAGTAAAAPPGPLAAAPSGPCTDPAGVTVVVDATELGGAVTVGCATTPTTGTDALEKAGFADTRDAASMICAIDKQPDPCPATFAGQYWSYWFVKDGQWQTYMEGSDTSKPAAGAVEGWRWADGSTPPKVDPATLVAGAAAAPSESAAASPSASASASPSESASASPSASPSADGTTTAEKPADNASGGLSLPAKIGLVVVLAAAVVAAVVLRRRRAS